MSQIRGPENGWCVRMWRSKHHGGHAGDAGSLAIVRRWPYTDLSTGEWRSQALIDGMTVNRREYEGVYIRRSFKSL